MVTLWPATNAGPAADQLAAAARSAWPSARSGDSITPQLLAQMPDVAQRRQQSLVQAQATADAAPAAQPSGSAQQIAEGMLASYGWSSSQFSCLNSLWSEESGWSVTATNPSSGAYGIPQALPGSKMASAGPDWQTDAATQIRWGLNYIQAQYGSPCGAWAHEEADGWY